MDLTQSLRQLEGTGLGNPLNQMDLRRLQNGILGRSSSVMELPQTASMPMSLNPQGNANPLGLSGSAMLVGTVAALQEESGQLRSQWQSDVFRLERELHQLRTAAAYALPQLVEAQKQPDIRTEPNLQALVLAGVGGVGSLQQTAGFGCPAPGGDRDQLLGRIAELEQQRKHMEIQRDQALMSQRLCGSAGSDCSGAAFERAEALMTDRSHLPLWKTYGAAAKPPLTYTLGAKLQGTPLFFLPALLRPLTTHGVLRVPSKEPQKLLELWGTEASPFVKLVREALCVLELPYVLHNIAHGSIAKRSEFREKYGGKLSVLRRNAGATVVQMPFLHDPNTGAELLESADIVRYLYATYQDGPISSESFLDYSTKGATAGHGTIESMGLKNPNAAKTD